MSDSRRRSRRAELLELRARVAELERQLGDLQRRKLPIDEQLQTFDAELEADERLEPPDEASASAAALWARTARAQKDQRVRAELENARLKESLEGQLKVALSLDRLLRKRPLDEVGGLAAVSMKATEADWGFAG